jgi:hypothetical protein
MIADDPQLRPGRIHDPGIDPVGQQTQQAIHSAHASQDFLPGGRELIRPHFRLAEVIYQFQAAFKDDTGYKNPGFRHTLMLS